MREGICPGRGAARGPGLRAWTEHGCVARHGGGGDPLGTLGGGGLLSRLQGPSLGSEGFPPVPMSRGVRGRLSVDGGLPARAAGLTEPRGLRRHHAVAVTHSRRLWLEPRPLGSPSRWPHTHSRNPVLGAGLQPLWHLPPRRASPPSCPRPLQLLPAPRSCPGEEPRTHCRRCSQRQ